jgi:hypothetical protein
MSSGSAILLKNIWFGCKNQEHFKQKQGSSFVQAYNSKTKSRILLTIHEQSGINKGGIDPLFFTVLYTKQKS